ncbi:hypothetical protein GCM10017774_78240 [Lentzea cavernae]|uniref:Uncharacterized protein n=1 Tax=Lentzea cavernae TaxID=2020703 RepID=A0ABQ3MSU6_9PSEU|nr:hypothetical protein GCM10017774_78240 [Lentzea cavernae]
MAMWFSALCTASAEPMVAECPTSVDGRHWCTDLPAHDDLHRCLCKAWFSEKGLIVQNQARQSAESSQAVLDSEPH